MEREPHLLFVSTFFLYMYMQIIETIIFREMERIIARSSGCKRSPAVAVGVMSTAAGGN